jgi:hypothetical protein
MKALTIFCLSLIVFVIITKVESQTQTQFSTFPPEVKTAIDTLVADYTNMKANYDYKKLIADMQAVVKVAEPSMSEAPERFQKWFKKVKDSIQALQTGTLDHKQVWDDITFLERLLKKSDYF